MTYSSLQARLQEVSIILVSNAARYRVGTLLMTYASPTTPGEGNQVFFQVWPCRVDPSIRIEFFVVRID